MFKKNLGVSSLKLPTEQRRNT